ncbi:MAG: hypothetical protein CMG94_00570 [Marinoscillum sp.]|nr:hypothetical protein [Marinoscillum sp.]OUX27287.1 MAG: hypothetical protein CBE22_00180 [Flammeovirgaceae bacterium TMED262]|tara:strand:+ start:1011 stop:1862 length:852 start_codon:yes stop_codon:yes gene_type:complete
MYLSNLPFNMIRIFYFILSLLFISCDDETPIGDNFVVEAFLFQGEKVDDIKIKETKSWNSDDTVDVMIDNANIKLYANGDEFNLSYDNLRQSYISNEEIDIISGNTYGIRVEVNDRVATAETIVPTKPVGLRLSNDKIVVPSLKLSPALPNILSDLFQNARTNIMWDNPTNEYHYLTIKYVSAQDDPIFTEDFPGAIGDFFSNFSLQSAPSQDELYNVICMSLKNYGKYMVTLYKINEDYVRLFESEVQDGTELNEPPSNIINAFGIFSSFASDTTSFEIVRQ